MNKPQIFCTQETYNKFIEGGFVKKQVLHVGCGGDALATKENYNAEEYEETRLDIDASCNPDICCSMLDISKHVAPNSFDLIYSSHNLEHLHPHEVVQALRQFLYVMKEGGTLIAQTPDLIQACQMIVDGKINEPAYFLQDGQSPVAPIDMLYGYTEWLQDNPYMSHKTGFTADSLAGYLRFTGFKDIKVAADNTFSLWAYAKK